MERPIDEWVNKIHCGDALDLLPLLPEGSVDLVLTDPPYGIEEPAVVRRDGGKFGVAKPIGLGLVENLQVAKGVSFRDWIPLAVRCLKRTGVLITMCRKEDISRICDFLEELGMTVRHVGAWVKRNPPPQARKVQWMSGWEPFIIATMGSGHHYNYREGQHPDVIMTPICQGRERLGHPAQKPEALAEPLVRWWSFPGDVVLDPFCGTGTFLAVAHRLGRRWIGIEKDERYAEMARRRLEALLPQSRLPDFGENLK